MQWILSEILGQFIGVGVLALIIVFQQEIRRFYYWLVPKAQLPILTRIYQKLSIGQK